MTVSDCDSWRAHLEAVISEGFVALNGVRLLTGSRSPGHRVGGFDDFLSTSREKVMKCDPMCSVSI